MYFRARVKFLVGGLGWIVSKQVLCAGICVNCTLFKMRVEETNNKKYTHANQSDPL